MADKKNDKNEFSRRKTIRVRTDNGDIDETMKFFEQIHRNE